MHITGKLFSRYNMDFPSGHVMSDVVEKAEITMQTGLLPESLGEGFREESSQDLAVGISKISGSVHSSDVTPAPGGICRGPGKFPVRKRTLFLLKQADIIAADLMPQPSGSAMDHKRELPRKQTPPAGCHLIAKGRYFSDLQKMVSSAQASGFTDSPLHGSGADCIFFSREPPTVFTIVQISSRSEPLFHSSFGSPGYKAPETLLFEDLDRPFTSSAGTTGCKTRRDSSDNVLRKVLGRGTGQKADPAIDIISHAPGGDKAPVFQAEGSDSSYGKPISLMDVGHTQSSIHNTGKHGNVHELFQRTVSRHRGCQDLISIDPGRDLHPPVCCNRDLP
jgi:hypothetical protein